MKKTALIFFLISFSIQVFGLERRQPLEVEYLDTMKPVSSAQTSLKILEGGTLELLIEHDIIAGVTPEMIVWWFENFPERTIMINDEEVPWYWLWHPVDHIKVIVLEPGANGERGIATGARLEIHEYIGEFYRKMTPRVEKLDTEGIVLTMTRGGVKVARLEHQFYQTDQGTRYVSSMRVGTDVPLAKYIFNYVVRPLAFSDEVARAWFKHNVEEVGNFQFFLPQLYAEYHVEPE